MAYAFEKLPQLADMRGKLTESKKWRAPQRKTAIRNLERGIHHSATHSKAAGSTTEAFARFHVNNNDWPCIGYTFSIEPHNIVDTPNGPRAKIHWNVSLNLTTYHVGNSNDVSLGILIAGNYVEETLTDAAMASFADLNNALDKDKIAMGGMYPHSDYPGYAWKACSVYDPEYALVNGRKIAGKKSSGSQPKQKPAERPKEYTVQQGDTLYQIAATESFTAKDLMKWNDIKDPTKLKVGQVLKLNGTAPKDNKENEKLNWKWNNHNTEYAELKDEWTNGSEEITRRKGSPKLNAPKAGKLAPGKTIKIREIARSVGFIWVLEDGSDIWTPIKKYDRATGAVGNRWGSW